MGSRDNGSRLPVQRGAHVVHNSSHSPPPAQPDQIQAQDSPIHTCNPPSASAQPEQQNFLPQVSPQFQTFEPTSDPSQRDCTHALTNRLLPQVSPQFQTFEPTANPPQRDRFLPQVSPQVQTFEPTSNPPQHDRIHTLINRLIEIGEGIGLVEEWAEYHIVTLPEWRELQVVAEPTLEQYKLRLDYDPDRQELAIRMAPSVFHDTSGNLVIALILGYLHGYLSTEFYAPQVPAQKFSNEGQKLPDNAIYDNFFSYWPRFVLEVAYSKKPVLQLPEEYMRWSEGHIRTVMVLNLRYCKDTKPQQHSIKIYRLKVTGNSLECTLSATHILREYENDGTYTDFDGAVQFYLSDFSNNTNNDSFSIPFKEFLDAIDKAEVKHNTPKPPGIMPNPIWVSSTPPPVRAQRPPTRSQGMGGTR